MTERRSSLPLVLRAFISLRKAAFTIFLFFCVWPVVFYFLNLFFDIFIYMYTFMVVFIPTLLPLLPILMNPLS